MAFGALHCNLQRRTPHVARTVIAFNHTRCMSHTSSMAILQQEKGNIRSAEATAAAVNRRDLNVRLLKPPTHNHSRERVFKHAPDVSNQHRITSPDQPECAVFVTPGGGHKMHKTEVLRLFRRECSFALFRAVPICCRFSLVSLITSSVICKSS